MSSTKENRIQNIIAYSSIDDKSILEIGALDSPTLDPQKYSVEFLDYASTDELGSKGNTNPRYKIEHLVKVDYVCPDLNYSNYITKKFDLVIANHVIEHIADTIKWLNEISSLLKKNGIIFLSVPDKRYTFDIVRNPTTFVDVLRNNDHNITKPTFYDILEHFYYHKNISVRDINNKQYLEKIRINRFSPQDAVSVAKKHAASAYADVHCHVYTSDSFRELMSILIELKKVKLKALKVTDPIEGSNEFYSVLQKTQ